jgi:hypothetical protein
MPYVKAVKTRSGATAVQVVWSSRRGSREIEHFGSAHDDAELEALKTRRCSGWQLDSWKRLRFEPAGGGSGCLPRAPRTAGQPRPLRASLRTAPAELRRSGSQQLHRLVHVPPGRLGADPEPAASSLNVSPSRRQARTSRGLTGHRQRGRVETKLQPMVLSADLGRLPHRPGALLHPREAHRTVNRP